MRFSIEDSTAFQALRRTNPTLRVIEVALYLIPFILIVIFIFAYIIPQGEKMSKRESELIDNKNRIESILKAAPHLSSKETLQAIKQQETLINDVRQEVNNNIDKANLWLSFWMAVIAIFCGFVPIIIQYRLYIINRSKLEQEICYFRDFLKVHALHNIAENFTLISETKVVTDSAIKLDLMNRLVIEAAEVFRDLTNSISQNYNNSLTPEIVSDLIKSLLQISAMVDVVGKNVTRENRRIYYQVSDGISTALSYLNKLGSKNSNIDPSSLVPKLHLLYNTIIALSRCIH